MIERKNRGWCLVVLLEMSAALGCGPAMAQSTQGPVWVTPASNGALLLGQSSVPTNLASADPRLSNGSVPPLITINASRKPFSNGDVLIGIGYMSDTAAPTEILYNPFGGGLPAFDASQPSASVGWVTGATASYVPSVLYEQFARVYNAPTPSATYLYTGSTYAKGMTSNTTSVSCLTDSFASGSGVSSFAAGGGNGSMSDGIVLWRGIIFPGPGNMEPGSTLYQPGQPLTNPAVLPPSCASGSWLAYGNSTASYPNTSIGVVSSTDGTVVALSNTSFTNYAVPSRTLAIIGSHAGDAPFIISGAFTSSGYSMYGASAGDYNTPCRTFDNSYFINAYPRVFSFDAALAQLVPGLRGVMISDNDVTGGAKLVSLVDDDLFAAAGPSHRHCLTINNSNAQPPALKTNIPQVLYITI